MKYLIEMSQVGTGRLSAKVEVEADSEEEAKELAYESPIEWKVDKFSGEGYDIDNITLLPDAPGSLFEQSNSVVGS